MVYSGLLEGPGSRHFTNPDRAPAEQGVPALPDILVLTWCRADRPSQAPRCVGTTLQQGCPEGFLLVLL